jgi:primosomal replication protein N
LGRNQVVIEGSIADPQPLRYTPAGIPVCAFHLKHESMQIEAGHERRVNVEMSVVAMGEAAKKIAALAPGSRLAVKGFLSRRSQKSDYPLLHMNQFKLIE